MTIIGIGYRAHSGKDTAAEHLVAAHGFRRRALADRLKEIAAFVFGLTQAQLYGDQKEVVDARYGRTPRWLLQKLGEVFRHEFGADFWIDRLAEYVAEHGGFHAHDWCVPDVRYLNEVAAIRAWGGGVWKIERPGAGASGGIDGHASEHELDTFVDWDQVLDNAGTFADLFARVDLALRR
jgi:hypothetical protein